MNPAAAVASKIRTQTQLPHGSITSPSILSYASSFSSHRNSVIPSDALSAEQAWQDFSSRILSLFSGGGLLVPIEDINENAKVFSRGTSSIIVLDRLQELLKKGMDVLNGRVMGSSDEKLTSRLAEVWSFYFGTVIPYFQGCLVPFQADLRSSAEHRHVSVRCMALTSFRDHVLLPVISRLNVSFKERKKDGSMKVVNMVPKMVQMLAVLLEIEDDQKPVIETMLKMLTKQRSALLYSVAGSSPLLTL